MYRRDNDTDCLYYFQEEKSNDFYITPYCLQQSNSFPVITGEKFTFRQLRQLNINSGQLYEWRASIDIIESYQIYFNSDKTDSIKDLQIFYNCSDLWFGSFCQYRLNTSQRIFTDILTERFQGKTYFNPKDIIKITNGTCYTNFKCDYILPAPACLDWREICDGKLDCLNGEDEEQCSILETNICEDGFFRCRNGFCIPESLLYDLTHSIDCMDISDAFAPMSGLSSYFFDHSIPFLCDESVCEHQMMFICGECRCKSASLYYENFLIDNCENGRDLIHSRLIFQNRNNYISDTCWMAIICAFNLQYIVDIDCSKVCVSTSCFKKNCQPSKFQFPSYPIISNSIRLMYDTSQKSQWKDDVTPTYICYNTTQCKSFLKRNTFTRNDTVCQIYTDFNLKKTYERWKDLLNDITNHVKACSLPGLEVITNQVSNIDYNDDLECSHSSLMHCKGSSRCISKYRFMDGHNDCFNFYDEPYDQSCSLNLKHYHRDEKQNICVSVTLMLTENSYPGPTSSVTTCEFSTWPFVCDYILRSTSSLSFSKFCDKVVDLKTDSYGETDETNCQDDWPCLTKYTKCDKYWHCQNGIDELNCSSKYDSLCPVNEHYCQHLNKNPIDCIHINEIKNNEIQCLGAIDNRQFCRENYLNDTRRRYRCLNSPLCIDVFDLCNCKNDCPFGDDEYMVCPWLKKFKCTQGLYVCPDGALYLRQFRCDGFAYCTDSKADEMYCNLIDTIDKPFNMYQFDDSEFVAFPPMYSNIKSNTNDDRAERVNQFDDPFPINTIPSTFFYWYCNRGILVYLVDKVKCLCPPAYYGDRCQYQSERISITMLIRKHTLFENYLVFKFVVFLFDNQTNILSTEQITFTALLQCQPRFNIYLLYDRQPRIFTNYTVRIDTYSLDVLNNSISYRASWFYQIPFSFLPVYKLVTDILIPENRIENNFDISNKCEHGQWISYENSNEYFCLCHSGWSGQLCNKSYDCQCSNHSLCLGYYILTKKSICICETDKFGSLCYISSTICRSNPCRNNGICMSLDERSTSRYHCICPEKYFGSHCEHNSFQIQLQFIDVSIPTSILIYLVTVLINERLNYEIVFQRIPLNIENQLTIHIRQRFVFSIGYAQINEDYYLIHLALTDQIIFKSSMSTYISSTNRCRNIRELFNETILSFHLLKRAKFYHQPCLKHQDLLCFHDDATMCLCTKDRYVECYDFPHNKTYDCDGNNYCQNNGLCFYDDVRCPTYTRCICQECFYGMQCQFTTSVYSMTLDSIIGPYIIPNIVFQEQLLIIKISLAITLTIFLIGFIDNILSLITFSQKRIFSTGCGVYLFFSSINSICTIFVLSYKFIFFLYTQTSLRNNERFLYYNCIITDFSLQCLTSMNNWLHACVSIERVTCLIVGIQFDSKQRRKKAILVALFIIIWNTISAIHNLFSRQILNIEDRLWCVVTYHQMLWMDKYNKILIIINLTVPFMINILSGIFIIKKTALVKSKAIMEKRIYYQHLKQQFLNHKHLIITPFMLVLLALPRSILSFFSSCMKSEREASLFLTLYFLSFLPSTITFIVFILPSTTYLSELYSALKRFKRYIHN